MQTLTTSIFIAHPLFTWLFQAFVPLVVVAVLLGAAGLGFVLGARRHASHALPNELYQDDQPTWMRPARPAFTQAEAAARLRATIATFNAERDASTHGVIGVEARTTLPSWV